MHADTSGVEPRVTTVDRISDARRRLAAIRQPRRTDIRRPPGPTKAVIWRSVARGEIPSLGFFRQFVPYRPIAHVRMPRADLYVLNDPELIWEALVGADLMKGFGLQLTRAVVGDGILTSEGGKHRRHRAMVQPAFTGRRIAGYTAAMLAAVRDTDARWADLAAGGGARVELRDEMTTLTLDIVGRTLFGLDLAAVSDEIAEPLATALGVFNTTLDPRWELQSRYPSRPRRRLSASVDTLDAVVHGLIADKRARMAAGVAEDDMLTVLLQATDAETGESLSDIEVRDEVMTLLIAGHETTSMLLTWTWLLLFRNPAVKRWVSAEWDAAVGATPAELTRLPRTRAVLAESLRLYPPAWLIDRFAVRDVVLGDHVVPQGDSLMAIQYQMHRDDRFWSRPDDFVPERWITAAGTFTEKIVPRGVYFPFGFAARKCIGDRFALAEAAIALAHLGQRWHVVPLHPDRITAVPSVTLRPSTSVPAVLRPRS